MLLHWILDEDGDPQAVDLFTWAAWIEDRPAERVILQDRPTPGCMVSTVFLGLDHSFRLEPGPPVLWETMIFGGPFDGFHDRYTSRLTALRGHARALALVEAYYRVPRKTKQAMQKFFCGDQRRVQPSEARRLRRALLRLQWAA